MTEKTIECFEDLNADKRIRIDAPGFLGAFLEYVGLQQTEVAVILGTTKQNFNRYCRSGRYLSEDWLKQMARIYPGPKKEYWSLVQIYCN